jgi:hypothetical protein
VDESSALRDIDILTGAPMGSPEDYEPLFVINLCAAMTPMSLDNAIPGLEQYKLYQVSRIEDGRRRYRLRLGFFTSESIAEDVLGSVRQRYATAFTSCLCDEDLKHASGYLKRSVQDLLRTGRFTLSKFRDPNATGMMKALPQSAPATPVARTPIASIVAPVVAPAVSVVAKPAPPQSVAVDEDTIIKKALVAKPTAQPKAKQAPIHEDIVEIDWAPPPVARFAPNATQPIKSQPHAHSDAADSAKADDSTQRRRSLMQQAHAMATTDAAERAKVIAALTPAAPTPAPTPVVAKAAPAAAVAQKTPVKPSPAPIAPAAKPLPTVTKHAAAKQAASAALTPGAPAASLSTVPEWSAVTPPPVASKPANGAARKPSEPFHVGAGIEIPETSLTLESSSAKPATQVASFLPSAESPAHLSAQSAAANAVTPDLMRVRELAKQSTQWRQQHGEVPTLDTTQTIRTLSKNEMEDDGRDKWFTVQLAISDSPANLDTMPRLDIFEAYSLYSVAAMDDGRIRHALRLGFFREEVSAEAVMGYLRTFFNEPLIVRIADAEYERFANTPKAATLMKPQARVVEIEQKRPANPAASAPVPTINTVARPVSKPAPRAAAPATKRAATTAKKPAVQKPKGKGTRSLQQDLLNEAKMLGLTDTQIIRVQKNPSLLSRLVGKLTK